jgi:hypothetical protein
MNELVLFIVIQLAFVSMAFWEAYMEGKDGWAKRQCGWKLKLPWGNGKYHYTAYHFWLFYVFMPLLIFGVPFAIAGFSWRLLIILALAFIVGTRLEDFLWFVVNPKYPFSKWNPKDTKWYPWLTIGKFSIPVSYVVWLLAAAALLVLLNYV